MTHSKYHLQFSERFLLTDAFEKPEKYFGPNYATLLNFWWFLTTLTPAQEEELDRITQLNRVFASKRLFVASAEASNASYTGSLNRNVFEFCNNSMKKTEASHEIIGMHIILDLNESLKILPLFSNL
jgi:hypothetical protein